jgi:hypothetical protein
VHAGYDGDNTIPSAPLTPGSGTSPGSTVVPPRSGR